MSLYLYEEDKFLGGLNMYRKLLINEELQNDLDKHVEFGTIVRPEEFPRSAEHIKKPTLLLTFGLKYVTIILSKKKISMTCRG